MNIDTDDLKTICAATYDEDTDMVRLVIICQPSDLPDQRYAPGSTVIDREMLMVRQRIVRALGR